MNDEPQPQPVFPQYEPPLANPGGVMPLSHPKQQKPLFKMINRMMRPKTKPRSFKPLKKSRRKRRDEV
ncbi:MAG: hypothetical protein LV481_05740 [Methylacidiphilales bacterium]|nr:hypothetical protein [Candidatus Methylacidiphilales bacterium]